MVSGSNGAITVTITDVVKTVCLGFELKHAVFIHGAPGIGKSDIIRQVGHATNRPVYDIRLALMNPVDLRGIPMVVNGETVWMPPEFFKNAENAILFFDEFPAAPPAVQAAAYQIVLDRQIGEFRLPDSCDIVAAGNRTEDGGLNHKMAPALRNRFIHIEVEPDLDTWKDWAISNGVHEHVVGFLNFRPEMLYKFDRTQNRGNFPTPRSWARLSECLQKVEQNPAFKGMNIQAVMAGYIGNGPAIEFGAFRKHAETIPNAQSVIHDGKMNVKAPEDPGVMYAFASTLVHLALKDNRVKDDQGNKVVEGYQAAKNLLQYVNKQFRTEYKTLAVCDYVRSTKGRGLIRPLAMDPDSGLHNLNELIYQAIS